MSCRWEIFQNSYTLKEIFDPAPSIQALIKAGKIQWAIDGSLLATDIGLNVIDAILPSILHVLNEFFTTIK